MAEELECEGRNLVDEDEAKEVVNRSQTSKSLEHDNEKLGVEMSMSIYASLPCMSPLEDR